MKKIIKVILTLLIVLLVSGCNTTTPKEDSVLFYESGYVPLSGGKMGSDTTTLLDTFGKAERRTGTIYGNDEFEYRAVEKIMHEEQYGGELHEYYYFDTVTGRLTCMQAYIMLKAPGSYFYDDEKKEDIEIAAVSSVTKLYELMTANYNISFDASVEDIKFGDILMKANNGQNEFYLRSAVPNPYVDENDTIASANGSYVYLMVDILIKPEGVRTAFDYE